MILYKVGLLIQKGLAILLLSSPRLTHSFSSITRAEVSFAGAPNFWPRAFAASIGIGGGRFPDLRFSSARTVLTVLEILCDLVGLGRYISVARPP